MRQMSSLQLVSTSAAAPAIVSLPEGPPPFSAAAARPAAAESSRVLLASPRAIGLALHFLAAEAQALGFAEASNCAGAAGEYFLPCTVDAVKAIAVAPVDKTTYAARLRGFLSCLALFKSDYAQLMANGLACERYFSHSGDRLAVGSLVEASWLSLQTARHYLRFDETQAAAMPMRGTRRRMRLERRRINLDNVVPIGAARAKRVAARPIVSAPAQLAA